MEFFPMPSSSFPEPTQPLWGYENCGKGNTGQFPTNSMDLFCQEHDLCYHKYGLSGDDVNIFDRGQGDGTTSLKDEYQDRCDDMLCWETENLTQEFNWIEPGVKWLFCDPSPDFQEAVESYSTFPDF
jgi:hypothetical protein